MPKASPIYTQLNAGELSPYLEGRVDVGKYPNGLQRCENFIPLVQGPAQRRAGTRNVASVKDHSDRTWLVPFVFSATDGWALEFGDLYIRFYTNRGQVQVSGVAAYNGATTYAVGDLVSSAGVNYYCKAATTGNAPPNATYWYPLTGTIYEIPSPYALADMTDTDGTFRVNYVQSADVVYLTHPSYPVYKLSRFGNTKWTITAVETTAGPFQDINATQANTVYASAATGVVTLTASSAGFFTSNHIGTLFYLESNPSFVYTPWEVGKAIALGNERRSDGNVYIAANAATTASIKPTHVEGTRSDGAVNWTYEHSGYGWARITAIGGGGTTATATVVSQFPSAVVGAPQATYKWAFAAWGPHAGGYPTHCTFFRERLTFARGDRIWLSVSGDYENFASKDADTVTADRAISIQLSSDQVSSVQWMAPSNGLIVGTTGPEFVVSEITTSEPLGPNNVKASPQSAFGSKNVPAIRVGAAVLFVQRSGRKVREIKYDINADAYISIDDTILANHITKTGIVAMAFAQEPDSVIWCARTDGTLIGFTFNREQDVLGWHRHPLGGSGIVESVVSIPSPDATRDDLWLIVRRTINGNTRRYIEFLEAPYMEGDDVADAFYVDSGATYDGAPTLTVTGLSYLEGETVDVLADGATHPQAVVTGGQITLQRSSSKVQVGLPCPAVLQTMRIEAGAADGTAQSKTKRITRVNFRFLYTLGGKAGKDEDTADRIEFRAGSDPMDHAPPIFSGDKEVPWPAGYETEGRIMIIQDQPLPMTVAAIMPQLLTSDR